MACIQVVSSKISQHDGTTRGTSLPIKPMPRMDPARRRFTASAPAKDTNAGTTKGDHKG